MKRTLTFISFFLLFCFVTANSQLKVDLGPDMDVCYKRTATVTAKATGGQAPYKYDWDSEPDNGLNNQSNYFNSINLYLTDDIKIMVKVIDSQNQVAYDTVYLFIVSRNLTPPQINGGSSLACTDKVILTATPGYFKYEWNNGTISDTIEVTSPNWFQVRGIDKNGCLSDWSKIFTVYRTINYLDTIELNLVNPPQAIGDTFYVDLIIKISDTNKNCLPADYEFRIVQSGDNFYCPAAQFFQDDKSKIINLSGTINNQLVRRRLTFVKIIGHSAIGTLFIDEIISKLKFYLGKSSYLTIQSPVCYSDLLYNYQPIINLNKMYPNPVNSELNVNYDVIRETYLKIFISDLNGRQNTLRKHGKLKAGSYTDRFDVSDLQSGLYMMVFYFDGHFISNIIEVGK